MDNDDRYSRQRDIIPPERLAACRATVIGVGAIGRQVALQLAAMGVPWLQLVDFDVVEPSNLASQGFLEKDLGRLEGRGHGRPLPGDQPRPGSPGPAANDSGGVCKLGRVVFCCVDQIETRRQIWQAVQHRIDFFCDGRMAAEVLRVVTVCRFCQPPTLPDDALCRPGSLRGLLHGQGDDLLRQRRRRPDAQPVCQVAQAPARGLSTAN